MNDIKYLGVQGLEELIILAQNGLAKKADTLQFDVMPDPIKYIGKVVQYIGVSDVSFTRSHFYYSNGIKWTEENISGGQTTQIEMITVLPSWADADPQILYILKDTTDKKMGLYVKNPSVNDSWFTVETSGSFTVVDTLPQWADADSSTIYFKADGNILTGYIKKTGTVDAWYTLGGASQGTVDTVLSATSTNPVQNKAIYAAIQDVLAQVASVYHYKGSCLAADLPAANNKVGDTWNLEDASSYGPQGINVAWDGTKWDALGGDVTPDAVPTDGSQHSVMSGGVYNALLTKENIDNKVTTVDATATDDQYPSAKAVHDALLTKEDVANKVTTIDAASTDDQYPSAKAVHDALLTKENIDNKVTTVDATATDDQYPSAKAVHDALLTKEDVANKVTTIDAASTDDQYPSAKAVHDALAGLEPIPPGFIQNVDTTMQSVENGKVMRISKTAFDALAQRDQNVMYYLDEEHDLIDAKPTCRDTNGNLVKGQKIVELTKAQYDNLAAKDPGTYYMINDDNETKTWYPHPDWANAVTISAEQLYAGYTAPADGMFVCTGVMPPNGGGFKRITVNNVPIVEGINWQGADYSCGDCSCPVSKGDLIKANTSNAWRTETRYFVPWKA